MAFIVLLRGVNVGGHKTFRPSILARELSDYDVVNVGAAGTFVDRKPGSRAKLRAELLCKLPFEAEVEADKGQREFQQRIHAAPLFKREPSKPGNEERSLLESLSNHIGARGARRREEQPRFPEMAAMPQEDE